jgi:nitrite reductase/ring-hydroxylating ferredoxin subunit
LYGNNVFTMGLFSKYIKVLLILVPFLLLSGCEKEQYHPVPMVPVDFTINLEFQFMGLNSIGGYDNVYGGFGGIVIYRMSIDQFTAFDRACTYDPRDNKARLITDNAPIATCPVCGSQFLLLDGSPIKGPAKYPLRQYRTSFMEPYLHVGHF